MSASSANRRRILSLWLPRLPIDRIKRKLSQRREARSELSRYGRCAPSPACGGGRGGGARESTVRVERAPPGSHQKMRSDSPASGRGDATPRRRRQAEQRLLIYALDDLAVHAGLSIGLPLANARAICPELTVFDADEVADRKTLDDIADWCDRFTPLVALDPPHGLYLDITGCAHLFGGERALLQILCGALTRRGFAVSAAIASTSICARTLTRHASGKIIADGEEAAAVAPLPVSALGAGDAITAGLRRAGLKTIGDVAARASPRNHGAVRRSFHDAVGAGAGRGRCADQSPKAAAGLHRRKALSRTGRHRHRDRDEPVRARRHAGHGDGQAGQGRAAAGRQFLPHRRRGAHDLGRYRASGNQG